MRYLPGEFWRKHLSRQCCETDDVRWSPKRMKHHAVQKLLYSHFFRLWCCMFVCAKKKCKQNIRSPNNRSSSDQRRWKVSNNLFSPFFNLWLEILLNLTTQKIRKDDSISISLSKKSLISKKQLKISSFIYDSMRTLTDFMSFEKTS